MILHTAMQAEAPGSRSSFVQSHYDWRGRSYHYLGLSQGHDRSATSVRHHHNTAAVAVGLGYVSQTVTIVAPAGTNESRVVGKERSND
jgi:hypothetical protein